MDDPDLREGLRGQQLLNLFYELHDLRDVEGTEVVQKRAVLEYFVDREVGGVLETLGRLRLGEPVQPARNYLD